MTIKRTPSGLPYFWFYAKDGSKELAIQTPTMTHAQVWFAAHFDIKPGQHKRVIKMNRSIIQCQYVDL